MVRKADCISVFGVGVGDAERFFFLFIDVLTIRLACGLRLFYAGRVSDASKQKNREPFGVKWLSDLMGMQCLFYLWFLSALLFGLSLSELNFCINILRSMKRSNLLSAANTFRNFFGGSSLSILLW